MIFPPSAGTLSKATFSDKTGDGLAGGHAARQALVMSCRVPVGSAWLWQGLGSSPWGSAPNLTVPSAGLSFTRRAGVRNRAASSEIHYKVSYLYLFSFCKKYLFWQRKYILSMRRHHHELSKLPFLLLSMQQKNVLHVQEKHFKFTTTLWTTTKAPELSQILFCCSSRQLSGFTCRNTNSLSSSTDNHLPLPLPRKASYWLACASRWLQMWARTRVTGGTFPCSAGKGSKATEDLQWKLYEQWSFRRKLRLI